MELISRLLGNVTVGRKLAYGFGVVLLLALLLALAGYRGVSSLTERSHKVAIATEINETLVKAKVIRQEFLQNGNEQVLAEFDKLLEKANALLAQENDTYSDSQDRQHIQDARAAIAQYTDEFARTRQLFQQKAALRKAWVSVGNEVISRFDKLEQQLDAQARNNGQWSPVLAAARLNQQMALLRYHVRGYIFEPNERNLASAKSLLAEIRQQGQTLQLAAAESPLAAALAALGGYETKLDELVQLDKSIASSRAALDEQAATLLSHIHGLVTSQTTKRLHDGERASTTVLSVAVLVLVFGMAAAWLISLQIVLPLRQTVHVAQTIAKGDLSSQIHSDRRDEMGELLRSVGNMNNTLRQILQQIGDSVVQLASAAGQLSAVSEQNSAGMQSQRAETDQVATAINEMTASVQEVASNAEQAAHATQRADETTQQGNAKVAAAARQIELLSGELDNTAESMRRLQADSDSIGAVMDVIKAVAEQTNLLALNAAIEAARAGEAGRGFAVVADEVRSLASRTQASTAEIEKLIATLQHGAEDSVQKMSRSRQLSDEAVAMSHQAGAMLQDIAAAVSHVQDMNQQIAAAAEQQSAVAEEINQSVVRVRDIAEQTAQASEETARATEGVASLGTELQSLIGRFRL